MSDPFDIGTHEDFMLDEVLPLVVRYAHANQYPTEAAALAALAAVTTILTAKGFTTEELYSFMVAFEAGVNGETIQ